MSKPKVLIVDDSEDIRQVTKMSMKSVRWEDQRLSLFFADSGAQAVEIAEENPDLAVVLIDAIMETENAGYEASRRIREELGNKKVRIFLRSGKEPESPIAEIDVQYIPKDQTAQQLGEVVLGAIATYQGI